MSKWEKFRKHWWKPPTVTVISVVCYIPVVLTGLLAEGLTGFVDGHKFLWDFVKVGWDLDEY